MPSPFRRRLCRHLALPLAGALLAPCGRASAQLAPGQLAAIDAFFTRQIQPRGPGCVVALIRGDSILHWRGYGLANPATGEAFTPQTGFAPGSIYKHFYATALLLLAGQGRLALDDDIRKYLPEIPDYGTPVTVRHLATHTHGLREYQDLLELTPPGTPADEPGILRLLARQTAPAAPAGTRYLYGNTGPVLAGIIIQRVSGMSAGEFVGRHVLDPVGMRGTGFAGDTLRRPPPRAPGYIRQADGTLAPRQGGGTSRTSLVDLARWNRHFDTADPASRRMLEQLTTPMRLRDGAALHVGMSLRIDPYRGLRRVWAPGGAAGYRAMFMRFPDQGIAIALGCNREDVNPVSAAELVADVVLADEIARADAGRPPARITVPERRLRALVGTYASETGHVLRIVLRNGRLVTVADTMGAAARVTGLSAGPRRNGEFEMIPIGPDRFAYAGQPTIAWDPTFEARFTTPRDGRPRTLELRTNWDPHLFTKVQSVDSAAVRPQEYAGSYANGEVESSLAVVLRDGRLMLTGPRAEYALEPIARDLFRAGPQLIRFEREGGRVAAAVVSRGRVPYLRFVRQSR